MRKAIIESQVLAHCKRWEDQKRINKKQEEEAKAVREELRKLQQRLNAVDCTAGMARRKAEYVDQRLLKVSLDVIDLNDLRGTIFAALIAGGIFLMFLLYLAVH